MIKSGDLVRFATRGTLYETPETFMYYDYQTGYHTSDSLGIVIDTCNMGANYDFVKVMVDGNIGWTIVNMIRKQ